MKKCKVGGIYKIINIINGKFYVGSSINIIGRWAKHKSDLRSKRHTNPHLQNAFNKYGEQSFNIEVIEEVKKENILSREQFWLDQTKSYLPQIGYNINLLATGGRTAKYKGCKIKNCKNKHSRFGYCQTHWDRFIRNGSSSSKNLQHKPRKGKICKIKGCNNEQKSKGYCAKHYSRFSRYGSASIKCLRILPTNKARMCKVKGCGTKHCAKKYCKKHYNRFKKYGKTSDNCLSIIQYKNRKCKIKECNKKHLAKGYCKKHYYRFKKYGSASADALLRIPSS